MVMQFSFAALSLFFAADAVQVSEAAVDEHGFRTHRVTSEFQAGETLIRVLLPEKFEPGERLNVLYLLPVEANSEHRYGDGLIEAKKLDLANKHRLICVAPTFSHLPWYADHPTDKTIRQETYFLKVVVPAIEKWYPASRTRRPAAGRLQQVRLRGVEPVAATPRHLHESCCLGCSADENLAGPIWHGPDLRHGGKLFGVPPRQSAARPSRRASPQDR